MSTEEGKDEYEDQQKNNNKGAANSKNNELLNEPFVKELLIKIEVLKEGIIKERKTNAELNEKLQKFQKEFTPKIIKLEDQLQAKNKEIETLTYEKEELENTIKQLQSQPQKKGFFDLFNIDKKGRQQNGDNYEDIINSNPNSVEAISSMANAEMRRLNEQINQLKLDNETLLEKMNSALEQTENQKLEFNNKIKNMDEEIQNLKEEKEELHDRIRLTSSISSQTLKETEHFKSLLYDYKKGKEEALAQVNICLEKCNKLTEENDKYKKEIAQYETNSIKMAKKLTEIKNLYIKVNLRNQMYHVKKLGLMSSKEIDIIFGRGEEGNYVMRIDSKEGMEIINIQDVESMNRVENNKNKVDINYMKNGKKYLLTVLVPELVVDQFVEAYKNFYFESMKAESNINY